MNNYLLKYCLYYKGEKECPKDDKNSLFWWYEFEPIDTMTETTLKKGLKYFKRAIELGYMTRQPDGLLKWNESKAKLAYFISRIYIKQVPFKYICNVVYSKCPGDCNRLDAALYQLKKTHEISWKSEIDNIINSAY